MNENYFLIELLAGAIGGIISGFVVLLIDYFVVKTFCSRKQELMRANEIFTDLENSFATLPKEFVVEWLDYCRRCFEKRKKLNEAFHPVDIGIMCAINPSDQSHHQSYDFNSEEYRTFKELLLRKIGGFHI